MNNFKKALNLYIYSSNMYRVLKNNNDEWLLSYHSGFVDYTRVGDFSRDVDSILNSDFAKNVGRKHVNLDKCKGGSFLSIQPSYINLSLFTDEGHASLGYHPVKGDFVQIFNGSKITSTVEMLEQILNIEVPKDIFSEYHRGVIEGSSSFGKPFIVDEGRFRSLEEETFRVIEEPDRLVLKKRMGYGKRIG